MPAPRSASDRLVAFAPKVPAVTAAFWAVKLLTTGIGESASDALGQVSVPLAGAVGVLGIVLALRLQLRARAYRAPVYWGAVLMVAVFGTMAADGVHDGTGLPYWATTLFYGAVVAAIFTAWYRSEGTLSIHSITTARRERFYWAAVLATFALGTAAGDLTAMPLHLGFLGSVALFAGIILVPFIARRAGMIGEVAAFWAAYVVTRPLGASVADWLGKPPAQTGLGLTDAVVTLLGLAVFAAAVAALTVTRRDVQAPVAHASHDTGPLGLRAPQPAEA